MRKVAHLVAHLSALYFQQRGREFPWRSETNAFRLAVAEILLQKTRAEAVVEPYSVIVNRYPTAATLANAPQQELEALIRPLGLWQKRRDQLVRMGLAVDTIGPTAFDDWRVILTDVPGLGAYAARAIACFGRGERLGIVDSNVARILRRVFRIRSRDSRALTYQRHADIIAGEAVDPRSTNFGLLDLGAAVCLPRPYCGRCPFAHFCPRYGVKVLAQEA